MQSPTYVFHHLPFFIRLLVGIITGILTYQGISPIAKMLTSDPEFQTGIGYVAVSITAIIAVAHYRGQVDHGLEFRKYSAIRQDWLTTLCFLGFMTFSSLNPNWLVSPNTGTLWSAGIVVAVILILMAVQKNSFQEENLP